MELTVIVPARGRAAELCAALESLRASDLARDRWELVVVDDDSGDDTADRAAVFADRVVRLRAGPHGPAFARNAGAEIARGEVLVFVDADVCVRPGVLSGFLAHFARDSRLGAVFGAYDDAPPAPGLVSQYRNLVHHRVHVESAGEAYTFWAGCGAVRASAFREVGGFDAARYPRPQIEDIELGHRLYEAGWTILLDPSLQGTHLKRWTLVRGVITDIRDRGIPWADLILQARDRPGNAALNVSRTEKVATALVLAGVGGGAAASWTGDMRWLGVAALFLAAGLLPSLPLLRWLAQRRGLAFATAAVPLRLLYYAGNAVSLGAALARVALRRMRAAPRADQRPQPDH